jgi:hypothetical protein
VQQSDVLLARDEGGGTLAPVEKVPFDGGPAPVDVTLADVNNDGRLDGGGADPRGGVTAVPGAPGALLPGPHVITAWLEDVAGNRPPDGEATGILIKPGPN